MEVLDFIRSIDKYAASPLLFVYGPESYLIDSAVSAFSAEVNVQLPEMNLDKLPSEATVEEISDAVYRAPMLSEKKLVIIKNSRLFSEGTASEQKQLVSLIEDIPETTQVIFTFFGSDDAKLVERSAIPLAKLDKRRALYKALSSNACVVLANRLPPQTLRVWMISTAKKNGVTLTQQTADFLCYICGTDMYTLIGEIGKLSSLGKEKPDESDIISIASHTTEYSVFMFHDLMMRRDYEKAFALLDTIRTEEKNYIGLVGSLVSKFRLMYMAKASMALGYSLSETTTQLAKKTGTNPYAAKLAAQDSKNFSIDTLKKSFKLLLNYDIAQKSGMEAEDFRVFSLRLYNGIG